MPQQKKRTVKAIIATVIKRKDLIKDTIKSLHKQVNQINIVLNVQDDATNVVQWANELTSISSKVNCIVSNNRLGDAERHLPVDQDSIWLACDDDLIYPVDYVKVMLSRLKAYGGIVTAHGKFYLTGTVVTYYNPGHGAVYNFRCLYDEPIDIQLHVPGSGVMVWDGRRVDLRYQHYKRKNMGDIETARIAMDQGVDITGVSHEQGWIKYNDPGEDTIWNNYHQDCEEQTGEILKLLKRVYHG